MTTDEPPPSFAQYVTARRIPATTWGDFIRARLRAGDFPDIQTWAALRALVETCREFDIATSDARAAWSAYQSMLRDSVRRKRPHGDRLLGVAGSAGLDGSIEGEA